MEQLLNNLYSNSTFPVWSAFLLGLMTAISPCPMATNITAVSYISKDLTDRFRVFINGIIYTFGRAFAYTSLALILYLGADQFSIKGVFQQYGERFIGPLLIIIGLFMLNIIRIRFPGFQGITNRFSSKKTHSYLDVFLLGNVFALAFCPYSGVLFFLMLVPMAISNASGLLLPSIFAVGTGIPVIIFAWLLAFMVSGVGILYKRLSSFDKWFRKIIGVVFMLVGLYYLWIIWI